MKIVKTPDGRNYLLPFILVTTLFFLWGFAHSILDVLNKDFQIVFDMTKARSGLVQTMLYGAYFLLSLPAGWFIRKWGYRKGVVFGLLLYACGALMFIPGARMASFTFFLLSLFVIGCGLTFLETSANPYITVLGDEKYGSSRLNLAQSFNGLGWIVGPVVGSAVILSDSENIASLSIPYMWLGIAVLAVAVVFMFVRLPEIKTEERVIDTEGHSGYTLFSHRHFVFGMLALFFYVAAQTGVNSFFINYVTETDASISPEYAGYMLGFGGMALLMIGRMLGSWILGKSSPAKIMTIFSIGAILCMITVMGKWGIVSVIALCLTYFFESIMFPTIFSMSVRGLGEHTKRASGFLIMTIVGGAVAPVIMGLIGEKDIAIGFIVPLVCYILIAAFSWWYFKKVRV